MDGLRHERRHRHACLHRDQYRRDLTLPDGIAITPNGATAYVTDPYDKTVTPIDTATDTPGTPITLTGSPSDSPLAIAITPNGATAYVTSGNTLLWPIDLATNRAGTPITLEYADHIAITPNGATAYVTDPYDNIVTPINLTTNTAETPITVGPQPGALAITPDQAPVARLSVAPAVVGQPTSFDASASTVAVWTITSYAWNFGDGSTATTSTPSTTHTYASPGPSTATVTETDSAGTSTTQVFSGQTMSDNGGPSAVASENSWRPALPST